MKESPTQLLTSIAHVRTMKEATFNFFITAFFAVIAYFNIVLIENQNLFIAMIMVVVGDWFFGTIAAVKNGTWETNKALKLIYYLFAYSIIIFVVLSIEKADKTTSFLSTIIIMPILIFQTISMLKNASLIGWIPKGLLLELLKKIDQYKNETINQQIQTTNETN